MRAVVQRVRDASISIDGHIVGEIDRGLLVYLGIGGDDTDDDCRYILDKVVNLRIFNDQQGKMNCSLLETGGGVLVISQFTLYGDARKGRRPSFSSAASPDQAAAQYRGFVEKLRALGIRVASGEFGAMMDVKAINQGPVTVLLDSKRLF